MVSKQKKKRLAKYSIHVWMFTVCRRKPTTNFIKTGQSIQISKNARFPKASDLFSQTKTNNEFYSNWTNVKN